MACPVIPRQRPSFQRHEEAEVTAREAEPLVETVRVGAHSIGRQPDLLRSSVASLGDRVAHHAFADPTATHILARLNRFDDQAQACRDRKATYAAPSERYRRSPGQEPRQRVSAATRLRFVRRRRRSLRRLPERSYRHDHRADHRQRVPRWRTDLRARPCGSRVRLSRPWFPRLASFIDGGPSTAVQRFHDRAAPDEVIHRELPGLALSREAAFPG